MIHARDTHDVGEVANRPFYTPVGHGCIAILAPLAENGRVPQSELSRRLLIEAEHRVLVLNAPAGYIDSLYPLPNGASTGTHSARGLADVVQLFARDRAQLERDAGAARHALKPGGILWASYPRSPDHQTDLSRNHGWGVLNSAGLTATTQVGLDRSWDAVRFQPSADVKGSAIPAADMLPVGRHATFVFQVARFVARSVFHMLFRFDVRGRENSPDSAHVVICNHLGWMDAISLLLLFPAEPRIHFLADPTSMMRNRLLWVLVRASGGIVPLDRAQRGNVLLFRHVRRCLENGGVVALFPEGDFGPREGELLPFKKGFAHFAGGRGSASPRGGSCRNEGALDRQAPGNQDRSAHSNHQQDCRRGAPIGRSGRGRPRAGL